MQNHGVKRHLSRLALLAAAGAAVAPIALAAAAPSSIDKISPQIAAYLSGATEDKAARAWWQCSGKDRGTVIQTCGPITGDTKAAAAPDLHRLLGSLT